MDDVGKVGRVDGSESICLFCVQWRMFPLSDFLGEPLVPAGTTVVAVTSAHHHC